MDTPPLPPLLAEDEPRPVEVHGAEARSSFLLIGDHAGNRIPRQLASLGLAESERNRHIALDIGIREVARQLARDLDATLILQNYSRLVIDCNRPLNTPESIVPVSDGTVIPGNQRLTAEDIEARQHAIFMPYHARIRAELDARARRGQSSQLLSLHSFVPSYSGQQRPWHVGLLYNRDERLAQALKSALSAEAGLIVGDNEPYSVSDETDYSIPEHGERRGLLHSGIEIRQDLIGSEEGQRAWATRLARLLLALNVRQ